MTLSLTVAHEGNCQFVRLMHPVHQLPAVWTELARGLKLSRPRALLMLPALVCKALPWLL